MNNEQTRRLAKAAFDLGVALARFWRAACLGNYLLDSSRMPIVIASSRGETPPDARPDRARWPRKGRENER